ncbi:MAG: hypothetical protein A2X61_16095 [Ignavibacteria bacterium GWB2_35_12]|nr:MAG: hypothetical protein A2X61_16095 [Ignavibacteria bacterium GWB2_35_12]OGU91439.1 MAG: hypothetical protein A2220_08650 [Ignavibacteria bacterium RIFOXYA2_FULL_35_10]OGV22225.1 MAG: hypothetical protein A2475_06950 [Ignavibacteria bacterium RIFOXYC2_FULL_35_21]
MQIKRRIIFGVSILSLLIICLLSLHGADKDTVNKTILQRHNGPTTLQKIYGDTVIKNVPDADNAKPGYFERDYTPYQDSAYFRALKLNLPTDVRISNDLNKFSDGWRLRQELSKGKPWQVAVRNINNVPSELYIPTGVEKMQYITNLVNSQYVPGIRPLNPGEGLVSLGQIASFLGLTEDVSPEIKFSIEYADEIEITVYSIQAVAVATIFKGNLMPGNYKYVWNGRDDRGKKMTSGDYIAEVKMGKYKYFRKRIVIP